MKCLLLLLVFAIGGCENQSFDSDKRQVVTKKLTRKQLQNARFEVVGYKQDTMDAYIDTVKHPIRYSFNLVYKDSVGTVLHKTSEVIFTPDGKSVLHSRIY